MDLSKIPLKKTPPSANVITILTVLVVASYYITTWALSYNFPISDDYEFLDLINYFSVSGFDHDFINKFFSQHNEHRPISTRLVFLGYYQLFNQVDFKHLTLLGNLLLLGIFFIFIKLVKQSVQGPEQSLLILVVACLLFQYGSAESMLWAMGSISNYLVLLLAISAFYVLGTGGSPGIVLMLLLSLIAVFSQGNGLLVGLIGGVLLLRNKRWTAALCVIIISLVLVWLFFQNYHASGVCQSVMCYTRDLPTKLVFALSFTGSAIGIGGTNYPLLTNLSLFPTVTAGLSVWLLTAYALFARQTPVSSVLIGINLFIIGTAAMVALSRDSYGLSQSMVSRYHINSSVAILSSLLLSLQLFPLSESVKKIAGHKIAYYVPLLYTLATVVFVIFFYTKIYAPIREGGIIYPNSVAAEKIISEARSRSIFRN